VGRGRAARWNKIMTNRSDNPPGSAGGVHTCVQNLDGSPPDATVIKEEGEAGLAGLPIYVKRLISAATLEKTSIMSWVGDILELDAWRSENGNRLSPDMSARSAWASDLMRLLVALMPAADRVDLRSKVLVVLHYDASSSIHGHLRRLIEYALRLDLARLDFPPNDPFARNLTAALDKSAEGSI